jgi:hypothetical protein
LSSQQFLAITFAVRLWCTDPANRIGIWFPNGAGTAQNTDGSLSPGFPLKVFGGDDPDRTGNLRLMS